MSRAPKWLAAYALRAESIAPKPSPKSTMQAANPHRDGARPSADNARADSMVPRARSGPTRTRDRMRPVAVLEITEAVSPNASNSPRAPTGAPKLSRIEGHNRPRVEPGRATLR